MSKENKIRNMILNLFKAGLESVNPYDSVKRIIQQNGSILYVKSPSGKIDLELEMERYDHIFLVGCGKAVRPMALAMEEICGNEIDVGVVVTRYGYGGTLSKINIIEAAHPIPDEKCITSTETVVDILDKAKEKDLVIALLSGGGSSLWCKPAGLISVQDIADTTKVLLGSGADIKEINTIRKHLSCVHGGMAAIHGYPSTMVVFAISDVIGDNPETIASGPFSLDTSSFSDALAIIDKYGIKKAIPESVCAYLDKGASGENAETPKPGNEIFKNVHYRIVASNRDALKAISKKAVEFGLIPVILERPLSGEARLTAREFCDFIKKQLRTESGSRRICFIAGGETTVTLGKKYGSGGRNQEFCLAAASEIRNEANLTILSCGTDGSDGTTDAAGAIVDGSTIERCEEKGLDWRKALKNHDSYTLLSNIGEIVKTGPTLTNVMDVVIAIACR